MLIGADYSKGGQMTRSSGLYAVKRLTGLGMLQVGEPCDAATAVDRAERMAQAGADVWICNAETGERLTRFEPETRQAAQWIIKPVEAHTEPTHARGPVAITKGA